MTGPSGFDPIVGTPVDPMTSGSHAVGDATPRGSGDERSLGEIVGDISTDLTTLVKKELELARTELKEEATKAGKGAGMLGGAGVAGLLALILGSFALAYLLDNWMPVELALLIVTLLWAIVGAVLAAKGRKELKNANPQLPETQQTLKEDAQWVKAQKS
ncbi:phage holin family protein [Nocardioides renjunii]|uniref:phage holin family protein n=1 Tax=Nocardioides renjunii TaxID=3095075 RepID=UPI002AFE9FE3|nr:phage holin family protein [Nocardioides sp. S-34]WQQ23573.1 phage holin family protein [Nocardioides sp. S-34]